MFDKTSLPLSQIDANRLYTLSIDMLGVANFEGYFTHLNPAWQAALGYPLDELISHPYLHFIHPDDRAATVAEAQKIAEGATTLLFKNRYLHKDGHYIWLSWNATPYVKESIMYFSARDITQQVKIERQREQLIVELDAFAHTVAHDLKDPLSIITSYADLLQESPDDREFIEQCTLAIAKKSRKMHHIIDELLRFASLNRGDEVALAEINMSEIIYEAKQRLFLMLDKYNPKIIEPETWHSALGYAPWLEEVWTNYLSNAIKYSGTPTVIELGSDIQPDGMVRFWVKDNGEGLSLTEQKEVFGEFSRLNLRVKGHGLGLSIVQRIVERLGGFVGVESQINHGSLFYFTLPSD